MESQRQGRKADVSESVAVTKSSYQYDYGARARVGASIGWVERLRQLDKVRPDTALLHFGTLLAGAAHVVSETFRDELVERVQAVASDYDPVVGGEMEAAGLAAACRQAGSDWMVVKGISDFATPESRLAIKDNRTIAARNAAETVMDALTLNARARQEN